MHYFNICIQRKLETIESTKTVFPIKKRNIKKNYLLDDEAEDDNDSDDDEDDFELTVDDINFINDTESE